MPAMSKYWAFTTSKPTSTVNSIRPLCVAATVANVPVEVADQPFQSGNEYEHVTSRTQCGERFLHFIAVVQDVFQDVDVDHRVDAVGRRAGD